MQEKELIQLLRQGNEPAFKLLINTYRNRVYNTTLNLLQNHDDADDVTQETFIKVFEAIKSFKEESTISTWILKIAVNKALDKLRRTKNRKKLHQLLPWWMPNENANVADTMFYHPGIIAENKEKAAILFKQIRALPQKQQLAFTLIKVQGMRYDEASEILKMNIKAVESLIGRAKINLQNKLENYYKLNNE